MGIPTIGLWYGPSLEYDCPRCGTVHDVPKPRHYGLCARCLPIEQRSEKRETGGRRRGDA